MPRPKSTRDAMIDAAISLIRARGISASGMQDIVDAAAAPRGSIYHHFPGGKDELVVAALDRAAAQVAQAVSTVAERSTGSAAFVVGVCKLFRTGDQAGWTLGCPIAATAVEGDRAALGVREAASRAFRAWRTAIAAGLRRHGYCGDVDAEALMILAALEGGLLIARGTRSADPYDAAVALLTERYRSEPAPANT